MITIKLQRKFKYFLLNYIKRGVINDKEVCFS